MASQYDRMAHLWRRAGFGAAPHEVSFYLKLGFEATVDYLVNYESVEENPAVLPAPVTAANPPVSEITVIGIGDVANWWVDLMLKTRRPLQERMVLFWHDHFATSYTKINPPNGPKHLYWQNQLERRYATGKFRDLMKGINRDPAMLRWLDNVLNVKNSPNENYARELFEIFMLGFEAFEAGVYTEPDVQQAARAFTGWGLLRNTDAPPMGAQNGPLTDPAQVVAIPPATNDNSFAAQRHDYTGKTVFGVNQNFNGDDIVDLVLDREPQRTACARMLGKKLFEYFAYDNPEEHVVTHLAEVLKRTDFDVKVLLRDLFLNVKEFYSERALHSLIKWPAYYVVSAARLTQATIPARALNDRMRAMGQWLFWPPDVFGWPGGAEWSTTSQLLARANWANELVTNRSTTAGNTGVALEALLQQGGLGADAAPEQVVDYFTTLLVQRPLAAGVRQALVEYMRKADNGTVGNFRLDNTTKDKKVRGLIHLLLSRPEGQNY